MRNQRFPWAEDHISRAVFWDEELPGILVLLGWARFRGGDLLTAIGPVKKALSKQPQDLEAQQLLTRITIELVDDKQLEKAGECADLLIALEPETAFFFVLRGRLYGEKGDSQSALADFSRALQLDPHTPEAHYNSGILMLRTQGPEAALREFDQELQISPDHDMAMFGKAEVLNQLGRRQEAIQLLQKVLILNPGSIPAYRLIARLQISEGNLTGATANLETASRMDPENAEIQLELSTIYAQAGRDADAAAAKARYEELKNK
jgi:tetratricopeptide (TPR) repeat protein